MNIKMRWEALSTNEYDTRGIATFTIDNKLLTILCGADLV